MNNSKRSFRQENHILPGGSFFNHKSILLCKLGMCKMVDLSLQNVYNKTKLNKIHKGKTVERQ